MTQLLWLDVETTGLDPKTDDVLAVAMMLTDEQYNTISSIEVVLYRPFCVSRMNDFVRDMHTKSGLLARVTDPACDGLTEDYAKHTLRRWLRTYCPKGVDMHTRPIVAGSSISFDRSFMRELLPEFIDHVHYRSLDVSSTRELLKMRRPDALDDMPKAQAIHLPMADILDSIHLSRWLDSKLFPAAALRRANRTKQHVVQYRSGPWSTHVTRGERTTCIHDRDIGSQYRADGNQRTRL